ncbi:type II toxin-antitoxin system HicA family toxin [Floridanema aerugineum]|uniref:Type II toxin-antitoxin system HicA family toxin n=1 Tax=Floridaenema aerugineum BLCC-F46 TaxID=3153654 RepID=A0ABV4X6B8_9CYAN
MSQLEKLIKFFLSYPTEARFEDVERLLTAFDFEEVRSKGSHHIFLHEDGRQLTIPKKGGKKVEKIYIKQITKLLRLEDYDVQKEDAD